MKLALTFEFPLATDQIDREGNLTDRMFDKMQPVLDEVQMRLSRVIAGDERSSTGCAWEIIDDHDGIANFVDGKLPVPATPRG